MGRFSKGGLPAAAALVLVAVSACGALGSTGGSGSSSKDTVSVDVGLKTPVKLPSGKLKVGVFMNAQSNQWQKTIVAAEKAKAASFGWSIDVLDFNFDDQKMLDAMQTAVTNHTYDAWPFHT